MASTPRPTVVYRAFRSDDLSRPIFGPVTLEIAAITMKREGSSFEAKAPSFDLNRTGECYGILRFPGLRSFI